MLERISFRGMVNQSQTHKTTELPNGQVVANDGNGWDILLGNTRADGKINATENNATRFASVYACINVLSDDIAKLPWKTYQKNEKGEIRIDTTSDVHHVVAVRPNIYMTPFTYKKLIVTDVCIYGNHYSFIQFGKGGKIKQLIPLKPQLTTILLDERTGDYVYKTIHRGEEIILQDFEVFHIKSLSTDGILGISPLKAIQTQMESMDSALKENKKLIDNGNTPQGILSVEGQLGSESKQKVRESWERVNSTSKIAVVDSGMKYQQIGITQADMQFLDAMKFNQQQIASIYKVPLHKINDLDKATYTNIEHQSLDYVKNTMQPWVTQLEEEALLKLYTDLQRQEGKYTKFNLDSELRGSASERAKVQEINIRNGFKTLNEIRSQNEDSPYGEEFANQAWITLNYVPAKNAEEYQQNKFGEALSGKTKDTEKGGGDDE